MQRILKTPLLLILLSFFFASCEKEKSLEGVGDSLGGLAGTNSGTAQYTLTGSPSSCQAPVISGTYKVGTALDVTNSVTITVDVTQTGTYTISTGLANGMYFTATDSFSTTGIQTIVLAGIGTPLIAGNTIYRPGANGCTFLINATNIIIPTTDFLQCKVDGSFKTFNFGAYATKTGDTLSIGGVVSSTSFETIAFNIIGNSTPPPGTYEAEGVVPSAPFIEVSYIGPAIDIWYVDINAPATRPHPFRITITSITATRVTGTFEGGMFDIAGSAEKLFTEGSFSLPIQ